eukprot:6184609-Prorocentrum_lima.AAC.1
MGTRLCCAFTQPTPAIAEPRVCWHLWWQVAITIKRKAGIDTPDCMCGASGLACSPCPLQSGSR